MNIDPELFCAHIVDGRTCGMMPRAHDDNALGHRFLRPSSITGPAAPAVAEEPTGEDTDTGDTVRLRGQLPEEFWESRPLLRHIRQAAHSRCCSADGVFYAVMTRLSGMVSHHIKADTGIGADASLNLAVALIANSGVGKSTSVGVARRLVEPPEDLDFRDDLPLGSGEGLAEVFMGTVEEPTGETTKSGKPVVVRVRRQVRHNAFFYVDEGESLFKLAERSGSTIGETIRRAAIGETLGQTNASEERTRIVPAGSYSLGLLIGFQPEKALPLLEDAVAGTPQRFLWGLGIDRTVPKEPVEWPGELKVIGLLQAFVPTKITFAKEIREELWEHRWLQVRGEAQDINPLDSHRPLLMVKVASLLTLLDQRERVTLDDWELARMLWDSSCGVRDSILALGERLRAREEEARTAAHVAREVRAHAAKASADRAVERVARRLARRVHESGGTKRGYLNREVASRDRQYLPAALDSAESRGWIVVDGDQVRPGDSRPS